MSDDTPTERFDPFADVPPIDPATKRLETYGVVPASTPRPIDPDAAGGMPPRTTSQRTDPPRATPPRTPASTDEPAKSRALLYWLIGVGPRSW